MSIILAKFLGIYILGMSIAVIARPDRFLRCFPKIMEDEGMQIYGGVMSLLFGAAVVSLHNVWVMDWPVIITILGWWGVIKGVGLAGFPGFYDFFRPMFKKSPEFLRIYGVVLALAGLYLCYLGWG